MIALILEKVEARRYFVPATSCPFLMFASCQYEWDWEAIPANPGTAGIKTTTLNFSPPLAARRILSTKAYY